MNYRLGLDIGTNSIGFAVLSLKENEGRYSVEDLVDMGVRIYPDGRNPKTFESLSLARRTARGMRRQRDRKIQRKKLLLNQLVKNGLFPETREEQKELESLNPYELRAKALDGKLKPYELGRALFHIGKRRGFKSNRLTDGDETEKKEAGEKMSQKDKIANLSSELERTGLRTLGEYLFKKRIKQKKCARFKGGDFPCYPDRHHYVDEFNAIRKVQQPYFKDVDWDKLHDVIFYQRPLKKQEKAKCLFYEKEDRAYKALPSFQRFRILQDVNNLTYFDEAGVVTLSDDEKQTLTSSLDKAKTMGFSTIHKKLKEVPGPFKIESSQSKLEGNVTACEMRKNENFGKKWDSLSLEEQDKVVSLILEAEKNSTIAETLEKYSLSDSQIENICKLNNKLPKGVGMLSARAMREIGDEMESKWCRYDEAVANLGFDHALQNRLSGDMDCLPYYGEILRRSVTGGDPEAEEVEARYGKLANPTVHITLNQLRKVVNALIEEYGKPTQVVIEMARDVNAGAERKREIFSEQKKNRAKNDEIRDKLKKDFHLAHPGSLDIKKFQLWQELGKNKVASCCPYCGKVISQGELFGGNIEIEHIRPYSRTLLNAMSNLTLAHRKCNQDKGDRSPYEAFHTNPDGYNYEEILKRVENLPGNKRAAFYADAMEHYDDGDIGFIEQQLNDTRYISKTARLYLTAVCGDVWCNKGFHTAILRSKWGLNTLLSNTQNPNIKNRSDHRHHSIDAAVIALTDRSMLQRLARENRSHMVNMDAEHEIYVPKCPIRRERFEELLKNMIVSFKPDHSYQGRIFKETACGLVYVPEKILFEKLEESDRILDEQVKESLQAQMKSGLTFRTVKNRMKNALKKSGVENPEVLIEKPVWLTTKFLTDLNQKDIEKERIVSSYVLKKLNEFFDKEGGVSSLTKKEFELKLQEFSKQEKMKRVRYIPDNQEYVRIQSVPNKWYENDGVCCAVIYRIPGKKGRKPKYEASFVSCLEAYESYREASEKGLKNFRIQPKQKPHPAAKRIMTVYKRDIIKMRNPKTGRTVLSKVASFSATNNLFDIQPIYSSSTIGEWLENTNEKVCSASDFWEKQRINGQNYKSINMIFSSFEVELVRVSPIGRIY